MVHGVGAHMVNGVGAHTVAELGPLRVNPVGHIIGKQGSGLLWKAPETPRSVKMG